MFSMEVMVHGYHKYLSVWDAPIGETLYEREVGNIHIKLLGCMVLESCKDSESRSSQGPSPPSNFLFAYMRWQKK